MLFRKFTSALLKGTALCGLLICVGTISTNQALATTGNCATQLCAPSLKDDGIACAEENKTCLNSSNPFVQIGILLFDYCAENKTDCDNRAKDAFEQCKIDVQPTCDRLGVDFFGAMADSLPAKRE